ncbi:MAG: TrkA family potassium uptake protein [Spirochaetia bacterium]|nr:TrkA family potassium uptake protein [Spirochaetia bacterium]
MKKKIAVIGLGEFGFALVKQLHHEGHEVIAIDKNMDVIEDAADVSTTAVCLDSTDEKAMIAQGLEDMDSVIIASAENLEVILVTSDILKRMGAKDIIVRYRNDLDVRILKMMGIDRVFNPEEKAALNMSEEFSHRSIRMSAIISDEYRIAEVILPGVFAGKTLQNSRLKEDYRLNVVTILRRQKGNRNQEKILGVPLAETILEENDTLILFGTHKDIDSFLEILE